MLSWLVMMMAVSHVVFSCSACSSLVLLRSAVRRIWMRFSCPAGPVPGVAWDVGRGFRRDARTVAGAELTATMVLVMAAGLMGTGRGRRLWLAVAGGGPPPPPPAHVPMPLRTPSAFPNCSGSGEGTAALGRFFFSPPALPVFLVAALAPFFCFLPPAAPFPVLRALFLPLPPASASSSAASSSASSSSASSSSPSSPSFSSSAASSVFAALALG